MVAVRPARPSLLLLVGASSIGSRSREIADVVTGQAAAAGWRAVTWDLAERPLPLLGGSPGRAAVDGLVEEVRSADMMVWVTPCYHGTYSGLLKNCLDHLSADLVRGMPVGMVSVGASLTAVRACDELRTVARALGCVAAPAQLVVVASGTGAAGWLGGSSQRADVLRRTSQMLCELRALAAATTSTDRGPVVEVQ